MSVSNTSRSVSENTFICLLWTFVLISLPQGTQNRLFISNQAVFWGGLDVKNISSYCGSKFWCTLFSIKFISTKLQAHISSHYWLQRKKLRRQTSAAMLLTNSFFHVSPKIITRLLTIYLIFEWFFHLRCVDFHAVITPILLYSNLNRFCWYCK